VARWVSRHASLIGRTRTRSSGCLTGKENGLSGRVGTEAADSGWNTSEDGGPPPGIDTLGLALLFHFLTARQGLR
jgi:hypothetical protein